MLADIRRRARTERVITVSSPGVPIQERSSTFQFTAPSIAKALPPQTRTDTAELIAIKKDLTKTAILATIAISVEFLLYWFGRGKI